MGPEEHGGVCELEFDGLEIPLEHRLLEEGDGLRLTQMRLGPARLTHCMRWLGLAKRCLEEAAANVGERKAFGMKLAERETVQTMLGDVARDIHVGRLLTMHAAWLLEHGDIAQKEVAMAKIHVADTLHRAADTGVQLLGAKGYSKDTVVDWIYRYARCARLVDGASEVHACCWPGTTRSSAMISGAGVRSRRSETRTALGSSLKGRLVKPPCNKNYSLGLIRQVFVRPGPRRDRPLLFSPKTLRPLHNRRRVTLIYPAQRPDRGR